MAAENNGTEMKTKWLQKIKGLKGEQNGCRK
jgi:hypothetical protein